MTEQPHVPSTPVPAPGPSGAEPAPEPPVRTGPWGAVVRVLFSPADVFALIRTRAPWLPPYLLLGLLAAASVIVGVQLAGDALDSVIGAPEMEEIAGVASGVMMVFTVIGAAFALVGPAIAGLVFALLLYLSGLIFDNKASFSQLFSLSGYAEMPAVIGSLISLIALIVSPSFALNLNLTAAALLPAGTPPTGIVYALLSMISPFTVWTWVLVALGLRHVGQVPAQRAWTQTVSVFVFVVLVRVGMSAMSASLTNMFGTTPF